MKQNWIILIQPTILKFLVFWPEPTHQPTHPPTHPSNYTPTHQIIHPPMGGKFFTDFKSLNGIEISQLVQVLSNFNWFRGSLPGGVADGWMGVRVGMSLWGGVSCTHACTRTHVRTHMHVKHAKHAKHGCLHAGGHLQFYTCVCVHVRACACMCVCGGHPPMPPDTPRCPPTHLPPPQSRRETKTPNFNNSWTNRDNSILFKDSLPLDIPGHI